jgi:hypothetical protein
MFSCSLHSCVSVCETDETIMKLFSLINKKCVQTKQGRALHCRVTYKELGTIGGVWSSLAQWRLFQGSLPYWHRLPSCFQAGPGLWRKRFQFSLSLQWVAT